uniref:Uncharacterized protein n=1 Tax=Gopherus agassizii TaxID=38772 RepID=A0A452HYX8_9SAUR
MDLDSVSSFSSLQALAKLLADPQEEDSDDSDFGTDLEADSIKFSLSLPLLVTPDVKSGNSKDIWNTEEVPEGSEFDDIWDPREQPEYEILFKQQVGAEDIFLGMSRKNPSTACCEDMLIKIKLPDTKSSDITLDIQDKILDLRTPKKASFISSQKHFKLCITFIYRDQMFFLSSTNRLSVLGIYD